MKNNEIFKMCDYQSAFESYETHVLNILSNSGNQELILKKNMKTEILCDHKSPGSGAVRKIS